MWYLLVNNKQVGPLKDTEVLSYLQQGRITPLTMVWRQGMSAWAPLNQTELSAPVGAKPRRDWSLVGIIGIVSILILVGLILIGGGKNTNGISIAVPGVNQTPTTGIIEQPVSTEVVLPTQSNLKVEALYPVVLYFGPSLNYEKVASYDGGDEFIIVGKEPSNKWLYVIGPDNHKGWIYLGSKRFKSGYDLDSIPLADYIPPIPTEIGEDEPGYPYPPYP